MTNVQIANIILQIKVYPNRDIYLLLCYLCCYLVNLTDYSSVETKFPQPQTNTSL